jgi:hypothetical protein
VVGSNVSFITWYRHTKGLHEAVALCMDHCHAIGFTGDDTWFKTVVLSGGTALLPGLVGRGKNMKRGHARTFSLILW